jgi:NTP pyrophosphatase (non-canonical NTP hydrolase)
MGYHNKIIPKGVLGEFSKIREEFLEAEDAIEQNNKVMILIELSDLLGAIEQYTAKYNITLEDLIIMKEATKRAFKDGSRKS